MASFKQHTSFSALIGGGLLPFFLFICHLGLADALLVSLWCWFAGMLPDIDSDTGRPVDLIFGHLAVCLPFLVVVQLPESTTLSTITLVFIAAYYVVRYPLQKIFEKYSVHRGVFHSIPMGLLIASLISLAYRAEGQLAWMIGGAVFLGYFSHLLLDEMFSIDLLRVRVKRSFGSALTFSAGSFWKNLFVYGLFFLVIVLLLVL
jgi:membrane-bound metal-dependent hydrolase YbcI (DUF457 family)